MMCAAPYQCGEVAYYRAKIEQIVDKVVYVSCLFSSKEMWQRFWLFNCL